MLIVVLTLASGHERACHAVNRNMTLLFREDYGLCHGSPPSGQMSLLGWRMETGILWSFSALRT